MNDWRVIPIDNADLFEQTTMIPYAQTDDPYQTLAVCCPKAPAEKPRPVLVWVHGGGLTGDIYDLPTGRVYDGSLLVVNVRYRLAPAHRLPDPIEDVARAVDWVKRNIAAYGGDPARILLGGCSAGAYLAALAAMAPQYLAPYGLSHRDLMALILISGQMTTHFKVKKDSGYVGENILPVIDEYAPLRWLSADLPPILAITGDPALDMPARASENLFMCDTLKALGHPRVESHILGGCNHGGILYSSCHIMKMFIDSVLKA